MKLLLLLLAITASSCGKDNSSPGATGKDLFSSWGGTGSVAGMVLDMRNMSFGTNAIVISLTAGGYCGCTMSIGGTEASGSYALTSCAFGANGSSNTDPGCASFNGNDTYTKSDTTLTLCRVGTSTCSTWQ